MTPGIRLERKKDAAKIIWTIRRTLAPQKVFIPLSTHPNAETVPCMETGDAVKIGEKIADPVAENAVAVYASISGTVKEIKEYDHPVWGTSDVMEIQSDGSCEKAYSTGHERQNWRNARPEQLSEIFRDLGVTRFDANMEALHMDYVQGKTQGIHSLVVSGCESEPYLTSAFALMMSHPLEVLQGAEILRNFYQAERILIPVEEDQLEAAELLKSRIYFLKWKHVEIRVLPNLYPQGHGVSLVHSLFGMDKRSWLLGKGEGVCIHDVATAFAAFEAVAHEKPVYERAVTVGGECVVEPRNLWLPLGMTFEDALKNCRGLLRPPGKVVMNGPMKGIAQTTLQVPVQACTQAILALPKELTTAGPVEPCIRCNRCVDVCPAEISPVMITLAAEKGLFDTARRWGSDLCIECGNCSYVCPSKRPMLELIQFAVSGQRTAKRVSLKKVTPEAALFAR